VEVKKLADSQTVPYWFRETNDKQDPDKVKIAELEAEIKQNIKKERFNYEHYYLSEEHF
jgi:hypothetical protein